MAATSTATASAPASFISTIDNLLTTVKSQKKTLASATRVVDARTRSVEGANAAVGAAHTQLGAELEAADLFENQMSKYQAAMADFALFMDGKPPAPKKSAYELEQLKRQKAAEALKAKREAEVADRQRKVAELTATMKPADEKFVDLLGVESVLSYLTKPAGGAAMDVKAVVQMCKDSIQFTLKNHESDPDNALLLAHLRATRVSEYASFEDCLVVLRTILLYYSIESKGAIGTGQRPRISLASTVSPAKLAPLKASYETDWQLVWALTDRCLRDSEAGARAAMAAVKAGAAGAPEVADVKNGEANKILELAMDLLARQKDVRRLGLLIDRGLNESAGFGIATIAGNAALSYVSAAALLGRWNQFRQFASRLPGVGLEGFHRSALSDPTAIPDFVALSKVLEWDGKDAAKLRPDVRDASTEIGWGVWNVKRLWIKYKDGTASDPEMIAPIKQATQVTPNGQEIPLAPGSLMIRQGAYVLMNLNSQSAIAPLCGVMVTPLPTPPATAAPAGDEKAPGSDEFKLIAFMEEGVESQSETYDLRLKSREGVKWVWTGTYVQNLVVRAEEKGNATKTMKLVFDVSLDAELEV